ncbi:putative MFS multidrug transporter [Aaosphaeria arxii CBS 175.79]|uniref:Putative MFS multidrug transporter n=1 Tax=Aaosphaeria arxii CBS 175.79 TaxID=1450172 RepID=A0A6A5XV20_9PLEO|nr:putative MFS multidrug transporter [Aaosphaeria arxii CBS 175.79]KAF2017158.1 putative MFS multidrug transporter [Aaosphaeria arxii CBS 175.79]
MPDEKPRVKHGSEHSLPGGVNEDIVALPATDSDSIRGEKSNPATSTSGDRALVLMDLENGLVGWENAEDPENPQNWTLKKKWMLMFWMGSMSTFSPMMSSLCAPGTSLTLDEYGISSRTLGTLMISIFVLGYAVGPLFLAPLSEMYGRVPVINASSAFFNLFILGCSFAPNMPSLIIMRLLSGIGGSAVMTIVSAVIGDAFRVHERAAVSSVVIGTPSLAPIVGPIAGGFISQHLGWRWAYWILLMASGPLNIFMIFLMKESNHPTILQKKTNRLKKELGRDDLRSQLEMPLPPRAILTRSIVRPIKFLFRSPIAFLISLYVSIVYGTLYLLFTSIPDVFQDTYDFGIQYTGLAYLGLGLGMFIALGFIMKYNDRTVVCLRERNGGVFEPEMRLATTIYFAPFMPVSLFIYGWTARQNIHWIVPCLSFILYGFGILGIFVPCQTYMVDAFLTTAASAVAALVCLRSVFGAFLPLIGPKVYESLGMGWGNSLLGFVTIAVTPVPFMFLKWGGYIRKKYPVDV